MSRSSRTDQAPAPQPFMVRHLPLILTVLFLTALHQPLSRGLAPQIEYVNALLTSETETVPNDAVFEPLQMPKLDAGEMISEPSPRAYSISI